MSEFNTYSAMRFFRNLVAVDPIIVYSPNIDDDAVIINIERISDTTIVFDCDNGYTIRLDIDVYKRGD